jgi:tetratricopeptide (TPR) repeat protein
MVRSHFDQLLISAVIGHVPIHQFSMSGNATNQDLAHLTAIFEVTLATMTPKARGLKSMPGAKHKPELLELAQSLMKQERWRETIKLLKASTSVVEKHWELLWNLGWCYFKLQRWGEAGKYLAMATRLAPNSHACKFGLGSVYLKKKQYKKAEQSLTEALQIKEGHIARIGLALAYLAQGKIVEAENTHIENIRLKPKKSERYSSYADFLSDIGREVDAAKMYRKARELQGIN